MATIRITDKFARVLGAFRLRDIAKHEKTKSKYLMRLHDQKVMEWPADPVKMAKDTYCTGTEWMVRADDIPGIEKTYSEQRKIEWGKAYVEKKEKKMTERKDMIVALLNSKITTTIVIFVRILKHDGITVEQMQKELLPGHVMKRAGVKLPFNEKYGNGGMVIFLVEIPGTFNQDIKRRYLNKFYYDREKRMSDVTDICETGYGSKEFADCVETVML